MRTSCQTHTYGMFTLIFQVKQFCFGCSFSKLNLSNGWFIAFSFFTLRLKWRGKQYFCRQDNTFAMIQLLISYNVAICNNCTISCTDIQYLNLNSSNVYKLITGAIFQYPFVLNWKSMLFNSDFYICYFFTSIMSKIKPFCFCNSPLFRSVLIVSAGSIYLFVKFSSNLIVLVMPAPPPTIIFFFFLHKWMVPHMK